MSNIRKAFDHGKAFIPFITCGYPDLETTKSIVRAAEANGADLIELGIPFSDPTAEGPVIQEANIKALAGGVTTDKIFEMVRELRTGSDAANSASAAAGGSADAAAATNTAVTCPMVFMTYANVVYSYGTVEFMQKCNEVGIDGLILPDVPYEEKFGFDQVCKKYGLDLISLIAPTSADRIAMIAKDASGFIYIVSSLGVTGVRSEIKTDIGAIADVIRQNTDVPCAVGFGISTPEQAQKMSRLSDGAIVGSAIIKIITEHGRESAGPVGEYVASMKAAMK